jgi:hypothetical protein
MKVLTVKQPWAWAIMAGHKRVENRTWLTRYRGPLAIHAGLKIDPAGYAALAAIGVRGPWSEVRGNEPRTTDHGLILGAILGIVDLVDVVRMDQEDCAGEFLFPPSAFRLPPLSTGPYCWLLANPRPLPEPIPMPGRQGLWECPSIEN